MICFRIISILTLAMLLLTCEEPFRFDRRAEDNLLVVDGKVNGADSVQTVQLTRTGPVGRSKDFTPETGASITLIENEKQRFTYQEVEPGVYKIFGFKPNVGNTYHIDIQLQNGNQYTSQPDILPPPVPIDSAYFIFDGFKNLTLFSKVPIPTSGAGPYLRWRIGHVYQRTDLFCGILDIVNTCYYNSERATDNQLVPLLDGGELERNATVLFPIVETEVLQDIFGEVTYFTVYQEALTISTFRYWEKVNQLLTQNGSIFDAPPGQIRGNIININKSEELVLGLFYATYQDIAYVKTLPSDFLPLQLVPYCGAPGFPPDPLPLPECCYCPFGIARPSYWK